MEKSKLLRPILAVGAVCGALATSGCMEGPNTAGTGNEFTVTARVDHVGNNSVTVFVEEVTGANGEATSWFDPNQPMHQIHDNYEKCDGIKTVGAEFNPNGGQIELADIHPGDEIVLEGKIRESVVSCGKTDDYDFRPVYDTLTEQVG